MSPEKTLTTHAKTERARFLGYDIHVIMCDHRITKGKRATNGRIGMRIPEKVIAEKYQKYQKLGKTQARLPLMEESEYSIVMQYQSEFRGLVEYYQLAYNLSSLKRLKWMMEQSLTKTLARKLSISAMGVYQKFGTKVKVKGRDYKAIQVVVPREGKKPLIATWGAIPMKSNPKAKLNDKIALDTGWNTRNELLKRVVKDTCEWCGAKNIEVHHILALKDLDKYTGREKPPWVKKMAAMRRKTLVLCRTCHVNLHAGKLQTRQECQRSRNETMTLESRMR